MPYAAPSRLDEERLKQGADAPNISGGQGANFSSGVPGQEGTPKSSGQYANIQSYLEANKPQADAMGQKIAGGVEAKAQDAQTKIQDFGSRAPSVSTYDPNDTYSKLGSLSDEQKQTYRKTRETGGYEGPAYLNQVQGYDDAQKASAAAATSVSNIRNETGQRQELRNAYERPNYTAGENNLDQALLQGSQSSKQAMEGISSKYAGLDKFFNSASTNVGNSINSATTQALANKQGIQTAEAAQWKNLVDPIQARANQMNKDNPALYNRVNDDLSDDVLSEESLAKLGLTAGTGLYDLNLRSYLTPDLTQVGLDQAANSGERSKYQMLQDLVADPTRNQISANGKEINPVKFDKSKFDKDYANKGAEYQNAFTQQKAPNGLTLRQNIDVRLPQLQQESSDIIAYANGQPIPQAVYQKYGLPIDIPLDQLIPIMQGAVQNEQASINQAISDVNNQFRTNRTIQKG